MQSENTHNANQWIETPNAEPLTKADIERYKASYNVVGELKEGISIKRFKIGLLPDDFVNDTVTMVFEQ